MKCDTDSGRLFAVGTPTHGISGLFRGDDAGKLGGLNEHISVQSVMEGREFLYCLVTVCAGQICTGSGLTGTTI